MACRHPKSGPCGVRGWSNHLSPQSTQGLLCPCCRVAAPQEAGVWVPQAAQWPHGPWHSEILRGQLPATFLPAQMGAPSLTPPWSFT